MATPAEEVATPATKDRAVHLERQLARIRWFGIAFGTAQVFGAYRPGSLDTTAVPAYARPVGFAIFGAFALLNLALQVFLRRDHAASTVDRLGRGVFVADMALLTGLLWDFSFPRFDIVWVILYIVGLEGAVRFGLPGAMSALAVAVFGEPLRELWRHQTWDYPFDVMALLFRVGVMAIVCTVAGLMARNLMREQAEAERRAAEADAAARRESTALAELRAFNEIVLAGLHGGSLDDRIGSIVETMARTLGYEIFAIGLLEQDRRGDVLRCAGASGHPPSSIGRTQPVAVGVCGAAALTGEPQLVRDSLTDPRYQEWVPGARSEVCAPIIAGGRVIGVLDVEAAVPNAFGEEDVRRLQRLAPQIGLVIVNARLLELERRTVERLTELDEMKSDFVAITSHELRTPLTSIQGFIRTLRRSDFPVTPDEAGEFLAIIERQTDRLARLVEDLLVASRIEGGTLHLVTEKTTVDAVLREVLETIGGGAARVRVAIEPNAPPMVTDAQRLGQIVRNLLENALKFSPPASEVRLTATRENGMLTIDVADAGEGIPPDDLERVFDRFHQVGGSLRREGAGFGLGLYIARKLAEALGGAIDVWSRQGVGTTFRVRIPFIAADRAVSNA